MNNAIVELVVEAAAKFILPRYQSLTAGQVRTKSGPKDLVTIADEEAERWLSPRLMALLPGAVVVGEEAVASDPGILEKLRGTQPVWLIDPVDGTLNFAEGRPDFCVMVALVLDGVIESGVIYEPLKGRCCVAQRGQGAWLRELSLGTLLRLPGPVTGPTAALDGFVYHRPLKERTVGVRHRRLGSAGVEYVRLAMGQEAFSLYDRNMPWDHAAGSLLVTESGGRVAQVDGSSYRPGPDPGVPLLSAGASTWEDVRTALTLAP